MVRPRGRRGAVAAAAGLALAGWVLAGCGGGLSRRAYDRVELGMRPERVRRILGAPTYEFADEWVYTADRPDDLTRVAVHFAAQDGGRSVVGKAWQDPNRPAKNDRQGRVP